MGVRSEGATIIYTTHYMEEAERICDRITIMDKGRELVSGTTEALKASSQVGEVILAEVYDLNDEVLGKFQELQGVSDFSYEPGNLRISFSKGHSQLINVLSIFEENSIDLLKLNIQQPSLNDVFLEITGKELRDVG